MRRSDPEGIPVRMKRKGVASRKPQAGDRVAAGDRAAAGTRGDDGFSLVETMVSLFIVSFVLTAALPFFISALQTTAGLGTKQAAVTVASRQFEYVRSVSPDQLLSGRSFADVATLNGTPGAVDLSADLTGTNAGNFDPVAAVGSPTAVVPLISTQTVNNVIYTTRTYINVCYLSKATLTTPASCTATPTNGPKAYRVTVDVSWPRTTGVTCASGRPGSCEYISTTLVDSSQDPVFSLTVAPTISSMSLTSMHPGQGGTLSIVGTGFVSGATVYSDSGDDLGGVISNSGTTVTVPLQASALVGVHSLMVINPDGGSATKTLSVAISAPTLTGVSTSPTSIADGVPIHVTMTGTDFFAAQTVTGSKVQPAIIISEKATISGGTVTATANVTSTAVVSKTTVTFDVTFPVLSPSSYATTVTITFTNPDGAASSNSLVYSFTMG